MQGGVPGATSSKYPAACNCSGQARLHRYSGLHAMAKREGTRMTTQFTELCVQSLDGGATTSSFHTSAGIPGNKRRRRRAMECLP